MAVESTAGSGPLVALRGITKAFPGVVANDHVDLDIRAGEIHALLGENGAGKSTLVKILYGYYRADAGEVRFNGRAVQIRSPHDARRLGIGMVFQTFTLVPALSVAENIALFLPDLPSVLDQKAIARRIEDLSERYGLRVDPWAPVWRLSIGEQQKVEVLKLLLAEARVLILDEPTRVLAPHEIEGLFQVLHNLRRDGYAIVLIAHKLHEVLACADRITVMRRGRLAGTLSRAEATEAGLVSLMFGAAPPEPRPARVGRRDGHERPLLELRRVSTHRGGGAVSLSEVDLTVMPGEIVGIAGVSGNGQRELGDLVLGLEPCAGGTKVLFGEDATGWPVGRVRDSGVAFVPEEPARMAIVPWLSVLENMALADLRRYVRHGGFSIDWGLAREDAVRGLQRLSVNVPSPYVMAGTLSGGNIQRVSLAREIVRQPRLIVAFYPTRGLDVVSAVAARDLLVAARDEGAGVLLISEDLSELFALSDRLVVLYRGRIVGTLRPQETTTYDVGLLMTGSGGQREPRQ